MDVVTKQIKALEEVNPMLGLRGCRLGILYPEISEMQVSARLSVYLVSIPTEKSISGLE